MSTNPNERQRRRMRATRLTQGHTTPSIRITLSGQAVQKILDFLLPPRATQPQKEETEAHHLRPTLRPWIGIIDEMLKDDAEVPRRYRTPVMRILKTLREEHGFAGGYTVVQEYVRRARGEFRESLRRRSQNVQRTAAHMLPAIQASASATLPEKTTTEHLTLSPRPLRLSLLPRKPSSSEEAVFD